ncbi:MAG: penicillin-binding transpeptidase domain-containing protein [Deinococcota bacterium]|nr:penicillin-binding transpeptidase domain-containing protein [Deinococcota bacterium]
MTRRLRVLLLGIFALMLGLSARLTVLQILHAEEYRALSTDNAIQQQRVAPLRGRILARDGTALATSRLAVDLMYRGGEIHNWQRISFLAGAGEEPRPPDPTNLRERSLGVALASNLPDEVVPAVEELVAGQDSLYLFRRTERTYPTSLAAHLLGYTTEADPQRFPGYAVGELYGLMGLEASYQETLFGTPGLSLQEVNSRRAVVKTTEISPAKPGSDLTLTIDPGLQRAAEEALARALENQRAGKLARDRPALELEQTATRGALVALDPRSGEILALASQPGFDQHLFTRRPPDNAGISALLGDAAYQPTMNRAVNAFEPGSTFKLLTASALLENGHVGAGTRYLCTPAYTFGGIVFRNWYSQGSRGNQTLTQAIADSCNTWFYQATDRAGWSPFAEQMQARARQLGFGQPVGLGLLEERGGLVPTDAWVRERWGHAWRPGMTVNMAIGQGDLLVTPVQIAQMLATIVMGGRRVQPHLVKRIGDRPVEVPVTLVPGRHWDTLKQGMMGTTREGGTAYHRLGPHRFAVVTGGKTGTAQAPGADSHAWYMGYGPVASPEIVVVAFFQNGGEGSGVALPAVTDFMAVYWGLE